MADVAVSEAMQGTTPNGKVIAEEIRTVVVADKASALDVIRAAKAELSSFRMILPQPDITGQPAAIAPFGHVTK